jgi:hypothetical protein
LGGHGRSPTKTSKSSEMQHRAEIASYQVQRAFGSRSAVIAGGVLHLVQPNPRLEFRRGYSTVSSLTRRGLRVVERSTARGEWPKRFTLRWTTFKTVSPKPAIGVPEHLNAYRVLTFLIAKNVIAVIAASHRHSLCGAVHRSVRNPQCRDRITSLLLTVCLERHCAMQNYKQRTRKQAPIWFYAVIRTTRERPSASGAKL